MRNAIPPGRSESSNFDLWLSLLLVLLAGAIFRITEFDRNYLSGSVALWVFVEVALVVGIFLWLQRISRRFAKELVISPLLLVLVVGSLLWEFASRQFWQEGRSFEFAVMFVLKNLMLGMGTVLFIQRFRMVALISSLFLVTFSAAMAREPRVGYLLAFYALGGVTWLIARHWNSLRYRLLPHANQRHIPWKRISIVLLLCFIPLIAMGTSSEQVSRLAAGWLPGSGGTGDYDPYARDGVGDGEMLIAGQDNITSFAPIEDAPFITDEDPSLYDVFDDSYEEPVQTQKQDRAIPLTPNTSRELETRLARSNVASREFSTLRKSEASRKSQVKDLDTNALMFVSGRVPLHLRMETYDIFDGQVWYPEEFKDQESGSRFSFEQIEGKPWLEVGRIAYDFFFEQTVEPHAIKVATIDTNVIPAPINLLGLHIDKVDRPSMFDWHQDSILQMNRNRLPEAVTIRFSSGLVDSNSINGKHLFGSTKSTHRSLPVTLHMNQVQKLAEQWTAECQPGWSEVEAIVNQLQENYQHDPTARPTEGCVFPVGEFLMRSRRGEDYQFATAAAVMLRSLGYSTRLVSGFYASPDKYDSRTGLTPVHAEDVHFWTEVYLGGNVWQTVEATPGYEVLQPEPTWTEQLVATLMTTGHWLIDHIVMVVLCSFAIIWLIVSRQQLVIRYFDLLDRLLPARDQQTAILRTARQLERSLIAAGSHRPPGRSPSTWIERQHLQKRVSEDDWQRFSSLWNQTLFLPNSTSPRLSDEVNLLCWRIRKQLSASEMKQQLRGRSTERGLRSRIMTFFFPNFSHRQNTTRSLIEAS